MKKIKNFLLIIFFGIVHFSCTSEPYVIGEDIIERYEITRKSFYIKDYNIPLNKIQLEYLVSRKNMIEGNISSDYFSKIVIGFDQTEYLRGDRVIVTFKNANEESYKKSEKIYLYGSFDVNSKKIEKVNGGGYIFYLNPGEEKKIILYLPVDTKTMDKIFVTMGTQELETRSYIILHPSNSPKDSTKKQSPYIWDKMD